MISRRMYNVIFSGRAKKDIAKLSPKLRKKLFHIISEVIAPDPYEGKKLIGDMDGTFSYRLTYQDRIVYLVEEDTKTILILRARTHYGE